MAVAETEADRPPPPPLCFPVDVFLPTVLSGGLLAREVLYYALCGAISAAKGHHRAPRGPAKPWQAQRARGISRTTSS